MFSKFETAATIKKVGAYSSNKASYATVSGTTIYGFFAPVGLNMQTQALGIVSQAYEFITDEDQDIDDNDLLTIASVNYLVKGVSLWPMGSRSFLKCLLEKPVLE